MTSNLLQQIENSLKKIPEKVLPDNNDFIHPSFQRFYRSRGVNHFTNFLLACLEKWKLRQQDIFSPKNFVQLLTEVTNTCKASNEAVLTIALAKESRLLIIGDLQGAAHSLARVLRYLVKRKLIDNSLKLKNPHDYLVINGNVIGNTHTNFEMLIMLAHLIRANKKNVLLAQGRAEQQGDWRNYDIKEALMECCRFVSEEAIPCSTLLDQFFASLPSEIIFSSEDKHIYVSPVRPKLDIIYEQTIDAVVAGRDRRYIFGETKGLERINSEAGAIEWSQFSAPTYINQQVYQFYDDAFTEIDPSTWAYTLHWRDVRTSKDFSTETFNLLTGEPFSKKSSSQDKSKLHVGVTLDLSETASVLGMRLREGIELAFTDYSKRSSKLTVTPVFLDDKYTPYLSVKNIAIFKEKYQTDLVFSPLGTPTTAACLPMLAKKEILVLFPYSGANIFRSPELEYIAHIRASYASEARALIQYADEKLKLKRYAFFYQNDGYGKEPLSAAEALIKDRKDIEYITANYMRNNPVTHVAAAKIIEFDPEAIFFFSTHAPSCALIHEINVDRLAGKFLLGISFLTDMIRAFCRARGLDFIISRVTPPQHDRSIAIVNDFHESIDKANKSPDLSVDSLEGFIAATLFTDIIEKIPGEINKESIWKAIKNMHDYEFRGLVLNFNKSTKELYSDVWVDPG